MKLNYCAGGTTLGPTLTLGKKEEVFGYMLNSFNISTVGVKVSCCKILYDLCFRFSYGKLGKT